MCDVNNKIPLISGILLGGQMLAYSEVPPRGFLV